ncbi:subtilisin family serine protease [Actinoplanes octamycinicus]|uniref:Subtilisin family serine protease n=1 Tax=Actinoplanes octamycinicus TaxID=135948 RepID=A0A7W7H2U1_9ACTN|nr:S8 family serine peptidase [Actinoplanes octamycinicus]MBB4742642.1 subtilisin family serine protease [Actinoplanes octamycinicus]GIE60980.1 type VII secretion-associated serine protease [Actinoplanes octamycinicus]
MVRLVWTLALLAAPLPVREPPGCVTPPVPVVSVPYVVAPVASGAGVRVAVVDSGVDAGNAQVAGRVVAGRDLLRGELAGRRDCVGHGTAVAASVVAVAPGVRIVPVRVADGDPRDGAGVARVADGIRWAAGPGHAQVINISLVVGADDPRVRAAVAFAVGRGVVVVAAAGNQPGAGPQFPAGYPGVLGVGAILSSGEAASFSPVGPQVDLVAVGDAGTSFAAGVVSGTAALVCERFPELPAAGVGRRLVATSDAGRRVNPYRAVTAAGSGPAPRVPAAADPDRSSRYAVGPAVSRRPVYWAAGSAVGAGAVLGLIAFAVTRARRRGWRPAD